MPWIAWGGPGTPLGYGPELHVPHYRLSTAGRRSFPLAASHFLEHCQMMCSLHRLSLPSGDS